jgi:hypothetical protein
MGDPCVLDPTLPRRPILLGTSLGVAPFSPLKNVLFLTTFQQGEELR